MFHEMKVTAVVLAAGQGTRMKSARPKVLHEILGRPMVAYLLDTLKEIGIPDILLVVGYQFEKVQAALKDYPVRFVVQEPQSGTGHALQVAMAAVPPGVKEVLVLCGDAPLISGESLEKLYQAHAKARAAVTIQTAILPDGLHYGRVVRDDTGRVREVVQSRDALPETLKINEINTGAYFFEVAFLREFLVELEPNNVQQELYLTDLVKLAADRGRTVAAMVEADWESALGINSRAELARAIRQVQRQVNDRHMSQGVTLVDPESTYIEPLVSIGKDTVIYPDCYLQGRTQIGENCLIEPQVKIADSTLADGVHVRMCSVITESRLAPGVIVGPFAHLRPGSDLRQGARVGNFVEVKKSVLHEGVKAGHLTYLGDAEVGAGTNVGAGTITCNYDGQKKHPTVIGEGAFIGSNVALVAPVKVGAGAYVGAGSTITKDVPPGQLGISRARQVNLKRRKLATRKETKGEDRLSLGNLPGVLQGLGLGCDPGDLEDLCRLLLGGGVKNVAALLKVATQENLDLIKKMYRHAEGKDPSNCEVVANLAHLAKGRQKK
jgi:bifunctional UDP-N-acetylglucosamine pyrophosphorylase/glucosamine-1-phosphate N-acetyltransferase